MKQKHTASPRALILLAATALSSTPALAQDASSAPPPVAATVTSQTVAAPAPTPAPAAAPVFAPRQEVVQPLPVRPQPVAATEPEAETAAPAPRRAVRPVSVSRPAPVREAAPVAPAVAASPAPVAAAPAPSPAPEAVAESPVSAAPPVVPPIVEQARTTTAVAPWMWIIGGIVALLAIAGLMFGRRRGTVDEEFAETAYVTPAAAPRVAAPHVAEPVPESVVAPVVAASGERPWIRMTLEPTATEAHGDASIMTYQLIVENEGPVDAHDVQVSSFLMRDASASPMEDALIGAKPMRGRIDVPSGSSVRVEASVVVADASEAKIVADARYPLPGGGEGHLAARFVVDTATAGLATRVDKVLERV